VTVADDLREVIATASIGVLDEPPEIDEDGDVLIWVGDVPTCASPDAETSRVVFTTYLVEGVTEPADAVLADLHRDFPGFAFVVDGDRLLAERQVDAPLEVSLLEQVVGDLPALVAQVQTLATRLGGAACVFEEETGVDAPNLLAGGCGCGECTCG